MNEIIFSPDTHYEDVQGTHVLEYILNAVFRVCGLRFGIDCLRFRFQLALSIIIQAWSWARENFPWRVIIMYFYTICIISKQIFFHMPNYSPGQSCRLSWILFVGKLLRKHQRIDWQDQTKMQEYKWTMKHEREAINFINWVSDCKRIAKA